VPLISSTPSAGSLRSGPPPEAFDQARVSATSNSLVEARRLGPEELKFWVFLNHHPDTRSVTAQAEVPASQWFWRDLRTNKLGPPTPTSSGVSAASRVRGSDAVTWAGSKRPTAQLQVAAQLKPVRRIPSLKLEATDHFQSCDEATSVDRYFRAECAHENSFNLSNPRARRSFPSSVSVITRLTCAAISAGSFGSQ
jgi:hypothetical protein